MGTKAVAFLKILSLYGNSMRFFMQCKQQGVCCKGHPGQYHVSKTPEATICPSTFFMVFALPVMPCSDWPTVRSTQYSVISVCRDTLVYSGTTKVCRTPIQQVVCPYHSKILDLLILSYTLKWLMTFDRSYSSHQNLISGFVFIYCVYYE